MYGKKIKLRIFFLLSLVISLILIIFLVLNSLRDNVVYFKSPTEIKLLEEIIKKKSELEEWLRRIQSNQAQIK